jgi:hypothetical protein
METNRNEIQFLELLQERGLHLKPDNELFLQDENYGNTHIFGPVH